MTPLPAALDSAEREARYLAGYEAIPDTDDDFAGVARVAEQTLRELPD